MPRSTPRSPSRRLRPAPARRILRRDDEGVSEVVGYILIFGILSVVLVLSMVAFNAAHSVARERAVQLRAESAAARVAGVVVQTAILAEQESGSSPEVAYRIDLPDDLEGEAYELFLDPACTVAATCRDPPACVATDELCCLPPDDCTYPDRVRVLVPGIGLDPIVAPLFSAGAATTVNLCQSSAVGGTIAVHYELVDGTTTPTHTTCGISSGAKTIFIQVTS
jgi:hypothetical protein